MELIAKKREIFGTKAANKIRAQGYIPAELYGHGIQNLHLEVSGKDFLKVYKEAGESTLVTIVVDGEKHPVLISKVNLDPVKSNVVHADFYQVRLDEKIKAHIPIVFEGVSIGVKEKGGILIHAMREIEVEAFPADLPHDVKVDISLLDDIGKSLHVKDLPKLKGVEYLADEETAIASVAEHVEEKVEEVPVSVEDVKVEGEEKKEKEAEEGDGEKSGEAAEKSSKEKK